MPQWGFKAEVSDNNSMAGFPGNYYTPAAACHAGSIGLNSARTPVQVMTSF